MSLHGSVLAALGGAHIQYEGGLGHAPSQPDQPNQPGERQSEVIATLPPHLCSSTTESTGLVSHLLLWS